MGRRRSWFVRVLTVALVGTALAITAVSISIVPSLSGTVTDLEGRSVAKAFVAYRYKGSRFNFVDSLSYYRPGEVLLTDANASYDVPGFVQLHQPLDGELVPWIEWVYVPELHHLFGPIAPATETRPGLVENDRTNRVVRLADLTDDPERWSQTIRELDRLSYAAHAEAADSSSQIEMTEAVRVSLRQCLQTEFDQFLERHADTPRGMPDMPDLEYLSEEERRGRIERVLQDLERNPLWGPHMEDLWPELAARGK